MFLRFVGQQIEQASSFSRRYTDSGSKTDLHKTGQSVSTPAVAAPSAKTYDVSDKAKNVLKGKIICLDPGHGGTDTGAIGHLWQKGYL